MSFSRNKTTNDQRQDLQINRCLFFIFAWGGNADINTGVIQYHGIKNRNISDTLICLPSASFCPEQCKNNQSIYQCVYNLFIACLVDCGDPGIPSNGNRTFTDTLEGSIVNYTCDDGFRSDDRIMTRICKLSPDGIEWTDTVPKCICKWIKFTHAFHYWVVLWILVQMGTLLEIVLLLTHACDEGFG